MLDNITMNSPQARAMKGKGRRGDTEMAHMTVGEVAVPHSVQRTPTGQMLPRAFAEAGVPMDRYTVKPTGKGLNPKTGRKEYADISPSDALEDYNYAINGSKTSRGSTAEQIASAQAAAANGPKWLADHNMTYADLSDGVKRQNDDLASSYQNRTPEQLDSYNAEMGALRNKYGRSAVADTRGMDEQTYKDNARMQELRYLIDGPQKPGIAKKYGKYVAGIPAAAILATVMGPALLAEAGTAAGAGGAGGLSSIVPDMPSLSGLTDMIPQMPSITGYSGIDAGIKNLGTSALKSIGKAAFTGLTGGGGGGMTPTTSSTNSSAGYSMPSNLPAPVQADAARSPSAGLSGINFRPVAAPRDNSLDQTMRDYLNRNPSTGQREYFDTAPRVKLPPAPRNPSTGAQEFWDVNMNQSALDQVFGKGVVQAGGGSGEAALASATPTQRAQYTALRRQDPSQASYTTQYDTSHPSPSTPPVTTPSSPMSGAGIPQDANQAAKRAAGYTGGFTDPQEFQTWASSNPAGYLAYVQAGSKSTGFVNPVDLDPNTAGQQTFSPDVNKYIGSTVGYTGDVGQGQLGSGITGIDYLSMNPDKVDAYSTMRKTVDPTYNYTTKTASAPPGTPTTPTPTPTYRQPTPAVTPTITPDTATPSFPTDQQGSDTGTGTGSGLDAIGPNLSSGIRSPRFSSRYMLGSKARV